MHKGWVDGTSYRQGDKERIPIGEWRRYGAMAQERAGDIAHKAQQYDSLVAALQVADGGRYRADTLDSLLAALRHVRTTGQALLEELHANDWSESGISDILYVAVERFDRALAGLLRGDTAQNAPRTQ